MGKIKTRDVIYLLVTVLLFLFVLFSIKNYEDKRRSERRIEREKKEAAFLDSLKQVGIEQERIYKEHLSQFYDAFNKYYPVFSSPEELSEWLDFANYSAFDLLHKLYSAKYDGYDGLDGFNRLSEYLFWGPPQYEVECETCGNTISFSEGDLP